MKNFILAFVLIFSALPVAAHAQYYGGNYSQPQGFFWPYGTGIGAPREVLTVHSWGPTNPPEYHTMNSVSPWNTMYNSQPYSTSYYPQQSYYPGYNSYYPQYQTPQYNSGYQNYFPSYSYTPQPSYYGGYGTPNGGTDIWGNPTCDWGRDYMGYACGRDPHQWIYDPYTGTWY